MNTLAEIVNLQEKINILDIGSLEVEGENINYHKLLNTVPCHIIGFDPNEKMHRSFEKTIGECLHSFETFPHAVADGKTHNFRKCALPTCSSLYEPNIELCDKFQSFGEYLHVVDRENISTYQLDHIIDKSDIDYIKIDIQGSELTALKHANKILRNVLVLESEVEFIYQYHQQPLFSEIEQFLRTRNFMFHTFTGFGTRCLKPIKKKHPFAGIKQWLWADAIFIKDVLSNEKFNQPTKLIKMALILDQIYQSYDFAFYCLDLADKISGTSYAKSYTAILQDKLY